jgi:nicotinate-nucleotide adenylyltransferase
MRLGIFGGTFDPVHYGHLLLAESCREQCRLDEVWFMPAATPPHKRQTPLSPAARRVEMLRLAISGHDAFRVSELEIARGGISYTVDTLATIATEQPAAELFFLMGADSLHDLPTWREPRRICELAIPVVVGRRDAPPLNLDGFRELISEERLEKIRQSQVRMPVIELSSTAIREAVRTGHSIRFQTPRAVEKYIETQCLYRDPPAA